MYQGKHGNNDRGRAPRRPHGKRAAVAALAIALVLVAAIGGTIAYLVTNTNPVVNTFTPGETTPGIEEKVENGVKKSIVIKNEGNIPAYIRVMLVGNTVDTNGIVTGSFDVSTRFTYNNTDWVKGGDGYYYYTKPVAAGEETSNLLGTTIAVANGETVTVLAQSIQAEPTSVVTDTWHVTLDTTGNIIAAGTN